LVLQLWDGWSRAVKSIVSRWLSIDLERHKADLTAQSERQMESFKNELRRASFEHETRFAKAHEKRAEVIAELYRRLVEATSAFGSFASPFGFSSDPSKEEQAKTAGAAYQELSEYFRPNRLFIEEDLCTKIEEMLQNLREVFHLMGSEAKVAQGQRPPPKEESYWDKAEDIMRKNVPPILKALEKEFREIIGIPVGG
jgi:hypothetical protein